MSTSDVPKLRVLSATLWSIVNTNYVVLFPRAANIVCEIYQTNPQIMPIARLTDILMDLKIKAVLELMAVDVVDYKKVLSLLNELFPSKGVAPLEGMSDRDGEMFLQRHEIMRNILLDMLSNEEKRQKCLSNFLKYNACDCHTKAIKGEVRELVDKIENHLGAPCLEGNDKKKIPKSGEAETSVKSHSTGDETRTPTKSLLSAYEKPFERNGKENGVKTIMERNRKENFFPPMSLPRKRKNSERPVSLRVNKKMKFNENEQSVLDSSNKINELSSSLPTQQSSNLTRCSERHLKNQLQTSSDSSNCSSENS